MLDLQQAHRTKRFDIRIFEKTLDIPYIDDCHHPLAKPVGHVVCIRQLDRGTEFWMSFEEFEDLIQHRKRRGDFPPSLFI
jgi:hypothetical protein